MLVLIFLKLIDFDPWLSRESLLYKLALQNVLQFDFYGMLFIFISNCHFLLNGRPLFSILKDCFLGTGDAAKCHCSSISYI